MKMNPLAIALQAVGATAVSIGLGTVFLPLGIVTAGIFAILFGLAVERRNA